MQLAFTQGWIFNGTSADEMNNMAMDMMSSGMLKFQLTQGQGKESFTLEAEPRLSDYNLIKQEDIDQMLFLLYGLVSENTEAVNTTDSGCAADDTVCIDAATAAAQA